MAGPRDAAADAVERPLRLFVGIGLDDVWRERLSRLIRSLHPGLGDDYRWVAPNLLHLTLVFLGSQAADRLVAIGTALEEAAAQTRPFLLDMGELGSFGAPRPRVIWVGIADRARALSPLHDRIVASLQPAAVEFEPKPLVPHITLARARRAPAGAGFRALRPRRIPPGPPLAVAEITLFRSELGRGAPRYSVLHRATLTGGRR